MEDGEALAGREVVVSEAVGEASAEETVEDLEGATKWGEGGSLLEQCSCITTRGRNWFKSESLNLNAQPVFWSLIQSVFVSPPRLPPHLFLSLSLCAEVTAEITDETGHTEMSCRREPFQPRRSA